MTSLSLKTEGHRIPTTETSHPDDPIPHSPEGMKQHYQPRLRSDASTASSYTAGSVRSFDESSDSDAPSTPNTEAIDELADKLEELPTSNIELTPRPRRASTTLVSENSAELRKLLGVGAQDATKLIEKCCGGGCCRVKTAPIDTAEQPIALPDNRAFKSLSLGPKLCSLELDTSLTEIPDLPPVTVFFDTVPKTEPKHISQVHSHPPDYVKPHPPYEVYSAPVHHVRELTKPGAMKRTYHFDIDVTDYPNEGGVDFKVGGAIGFCPPNSDEIVDEIFDAIGVPKFVRDKQTLLRTTTGRWPTIWGDDQAREVVTTRRELLTWCADVQSQPPTKPLLRMLAEHASDPNEKKILLFLVSAQGQAAFCDLRTAAHLTIGQILNAFPSSQPPLGDLLSVLTQLMPRFYSLSNDPHVSNERGSGRRLIEIAVTVQETNDWHADNGKRAGVGSGFLERIAHDFMAAEREGIDVKTVLNPRVPLFRGLMANPLSKEFGGDGPMVLIGAGVGMAPFRGFILNRLKKANCANKIWLIQGIRDSMLDEIYSGELGAHESEIKRVVQSRKDGQQRYVQDEVRAQADLVWFVINALDGRIFVCGSKEGMGDGVEQALIEVAMEKGRLSEEESKAFWQAKKDGLQFIFEAW